MASDLAELAVWLDQALLGAEPVPELLEKHPDLGTEDAYRLQFAVMQARVARGDRIVGYKAALTSKGMQDETGIPNPLLGTLLASRVFPEGEAVSLSGRDFMHATLEPEIAVLLKHDLAGPGASALDALAASAGFLPAVELGDYRFVGGAGSEQNAIACNTLNGGIVVGARLTSPEGIDLRTEGMALYRNGLAVDSGTGVEVLGDPLLSVAFMANTLARFGQKLEAGMLLMTGSITRSIPLAAGDDIAVAFTRLGRLDLAIAA
jgi:2-keto-4-pentenoate hydratase